ncbi:MAG TPA: hypothetical protein VFO83_00625 [Aggregicoccus sp.]|nr:hypothetical protein [Aggregicoccus sp.]
MERLLTAPADERPALEAELRRRATAPAPRSALRRLLLARAQDADEYLGASAEAARLYLALLDSLHKP